MAKKYIKNTPHMNWNDAMLCSYATSCISILYTDHGFQYLVRDGTLIFFVGDSRNAFIHLESKAYTYGQSDNLCEQWWEEHFQVNSRWKNSSSGNAEDDVPFLMLHAFPIGRSQIMDLNHQCCCFLSPLQQGKFAEVHLPQSVEWLR